MLSTADLSTYPTGSYPASAFTTDAARAVAAFVDTLIFTGGTGDSYAFLEFTVDGSVDEARAFGTIWEGHFSSVIGENSDIRGPDTLSGTLPFTYDVPVTFTHSLEAFTIAFDLDKGSGFYDYSGIADFETTSILTTIAVFSDPDLQNPVLNFGLSSESGTDYLALVRAVPEPATLILLSTGLGLLGCKRRRRKRVQTE